MIIRIINNNNNNSRILSGCHPFLSPHLCWLVTGHQSEGLGFRATWAALSPTGWLSTNWNEKLISLTPNPAESQRAMMYLKDLWQSGACGLTGFSSLANPQGPADTAPRIKYMRPAHALWASTAWLHNKKAFINNLIGHTIQRKATRSQTLSFVVTREA